MVVSGVAERVPGRIARVIYVDAFLPEDGESAFNLMNPSFVAALRKRAAEQGGGWGIPSGGGKGPRSEEHTSELQSLMRTSDAVFCLKKKKNNTNTRPASKYHTR